jgi:hypothetical protein
MTTTNCYLIEFLNLDGTFQYETFMAEDQYEAVDIFSGDFPKCVPYNIFMQVNGWRKDEDE